MPPFVQDELKLSDAQKKQISDLQKEYEAKLDNVLSEEQRKQYAEMKQNSGRGGPGGRGGTGGPFNQTSGGPDR